MSKELDLKFNNYQEDNHSFFDILLIVAENKSRIFLTSIIFFILGLFMYFFIFPYEATYEIKIKINPPPSNFVEQFQNKYIYDPSNESEDEQNKITKESLLIDYIEIFNMYEVHRNIMKIKLQEQIKGLNKYEENNLINKNIKRFYIDEQYIRFASKNINNDLKLIDEINDGIVKKLGSTIYSQIEERLENKASELRRSIDDDNFKILVLESKIDRDLNNLKSFLEAQYEIASELNILENQTLGFPDTNILVNTSNMQDHVSPYYLRGTKHIQAEINNINKTVERQSVGQSSSLENQTELNELIAERELNVYRVKYISENKLSILDALPLQSTEIIRVDVNNYQSTKKPNYYLIIPIVFLLLGFFIQLIYLIFQNEYKMRKLTRITSQ